MNQTVEGRAIVYCEGAFGTTNGKTAHGLVRRSQRYDLVELQGSTRAERARKWFETFGRIDPGAGNKLRFELLPGTGHRINEALRERSADFLAN